MRIVLTILAIAAGCPAAWGSEIFSAPQTDTASSWGNNTATPTYGQTITVPTDGNDLLSSFTLYIVDTGSPSLSFDADVQAWDSVTSETTGPVLYSASGSTATDTTTDAYTFNPDVVLTPGAQYVLFFTLLGITQSNQHDYAYAYNDAGVYTGGSFVWNEVDYPSPGTGSVSDLTTSAWNVYPGDLAFSATFDAGPVPEPASIGLVLAGLGALGFGRRRR